MKVGAAWRPLPVMVAVLIGMRHPEPVKLGLLVPSGELGLAARRGAEMAVERANREGGFEGRPFELVARSVEGPWGSGTSEITTLVFSDGVWAILGPLHGRSAHLAEQVAAKGHVALVSPWASDPTLTQANVPWFFRCVPDDRQQATALAREIFENRRLDRVVAVVADSYDARVAADAFAAAAFETATGANRPARWSLPARGGAPDSLLSLLDHERPESIVFFGPAPTGDALVRSLRARGMRQPVFTALSGADMSPRGSGSSRDEELVVVAPGHWVTDGGRAFERAFRDAHGHLPAAVAGYAYDGVMVIVEAIRRGGLDRARIRDALASTDYAGGITGRVRFDERGNREVEVDLLEVGRR